ncbi:hypothetical protein QTN47_11085 [Danxiaibacter flavus]|uniref:Uncharacterized protein n=1 Tax=Danxiaibacter flavus TaxID=3049108 RepID=A0ABV3ZDV6_9BACT|nr:hypothetical protein QNM32_11090 [Chitinophagaceae bacterium DXS]
MRNFLILIGICISIRLSAQDTLRYKIGDSTVCIITELHKGARRGVVFLNLHEDESTSVQACRTFLSNNNGTLIRLHQHGERLIVFTRKGKLYRFDPNRIFTPKGRKATLKYFDNYDRVAAKKLKGFANAIIKKLRKARLVVALHNNTEGAPLSILNYVDKKGYRVNVNSSINIDDFFLTTRKKIYKYLKSKKMNVAWELFHKTNDDGSLSIYSNKNQLPYVNIEALHGHETEQLQMLEVLKGVMKKYR